MDIYRNETQDLYLYVKVGSVLTDADALPVANLESTLEVSPIDRNPTVTKVDTGVYTIGLINSDISIERDLIVTWEYDLGGIPETQTHEYSVVTAYSTLDDLKSLPSTADATDEDIQEAARFAKALIEEYTGQKFGLWYAEMWKDGNGQDTLTLNSRISAINDISHDSTVIYDSALDDNVISISISPTARAIRIVEETDVIVIPDTEFVPGSGRFHNNEHYKITGWFGWQSVPSNIKDVHKLLVDDWFCGESKWRKRYIEKIKLTRDSEITFDSRSFTGTGNFYVDKLLDPYVIQAFLVL